MSPKGPYYNTYCYHLQLREDTIETIQLSGILFSETDRTIINMANHRIYIQATKNCQQALPTGRESFLSSTLQKTVLFIYYILFSSKRV